MAYRSLRDFIARLEEAGELVRVNEPVSTVLEMTEIQTRLIAEGGPAVIFENPIKADGTPSDMPVLVNLFGTVKRVAMGVTMGGRERTNALDLARSGRTAGAAAPARAAALASAKPPTLLPLVKTVLSMKPKTVARPPARRSSGAATTSISRKLPVQTCWPGEPAPLITWPLVVTKGPERCARGQLQSRHLSHAGAEQEPDHHALAEASRRGAASRSAGRRRKPRPCPPPPCSAPIPASSWRR